MNGNPHYRAANNGEVPVEPYVQAQATLALAYEQRTANLIDYLQTGPNAWGYHPSENVLKSVQAEIETRLGLA